MEDLNFSEQYVRLEIVNDGEGNPLCSIKLDDEQEFVITVFELDGLKKILDKHYSEIENYCIKVLNEQYGTHFVSDICTKCGQSIEEGRVRQDKDENVLCEDCFIEYLVESHNK